MTTELQRADHPSLPEKMEYAKALATSGMLPSAYKSQPANVLVAIEYGEALGIKPIVAINEINVISGTPAPSASLMASLTRSAGHKLRCWNEPDGSAVCEIVRADDPEFTHRSVWDEAKARQAKLWGRGHWEKDPQTMLRWRAISECVRLACPEVLGGMKYTPEEVMEIQQDRQPVRRVESEQVQQHKPSVTPQPTASRIPADLADRITASDDVEWLGKSDTFLAGLGDEDPAVVADLRAMIAARLETLAVDAVRGTLDGEIVTEDEVTA